jgi:hypothetical protein
MIRSLIAMSFTSLLLGCAALPDMALFGPWLGADKSAEPVPYSFSWRLSGDRAVAPLQVFDNGNQMWLQFAPGQAIPAIFVNAGSQGSPLRYRQEGGFVVLPGVWPSLVLRGGQLKSFIDRIEKSPESLSSADLPGLTVAELATPSPIPARQLAAASPVKVPVVAALLESLPADFTASSFALKPEQSTESYAVGPQDLNLRVALARWARAAGWTFEAEHWAVDADIPIVGSATFEPQFKLAVQELMASTELADRPLQPCFYSNKVLRIVPYAQACDRTANLPEVS